MMAGKNQAALAVCAQTKVIFPFKRTFFTKMSVYPNARVGVTVYEVQSSGFHFVRVNTYLCLLSEETNFNLHVRS